MSIWRIEIAQVNSDILVLYHNRWMEFVLSVLPISEVVDEVVDQLTHASQVILQAPPGAGKSTWLPLALFNRLNLAGKIILLEPRRLAAKSVATRLAFLLNEEPGQTVGYRMRGEQKVSAATRIEVVTEGILTRRLQQDPMLEGISLVILDEFHERSLSADLALALLLDIQQGLRDDLKLLVMSATLDNAKLSDRLPSAPVVLSAGRSFPVTRFYQSLPTGTSFPSAVATVVAGILQQESGSLLLFLPGEREINAVMDQLRQRCSSDTDLYPLFGALSLAEQQRAVEPAVNGRRKVVLATNIAETSLTIEGITLVVDSVLERVTHYNTRSGVDSLQTQYISQSSMTQRAGRAGRVMPGKCWHLLSQAQAERLAEQATPELLRSDLSGLLLQVLAWGCQDANELSWLDPLPTAALAQARQQLFMLGAVNEQGKLTPLGQKMANLGTEPRLAALLMQSVSTPEKLSLACLIAAIIEQPPRRGSGDLRDSLAHPTAAWLKRAHQFARYLGGVFKPTPTADELPLLLHAFADRIAFRRGESERYQLANGRGAVLMRDHELSRYPWLVVVQLQQSAERSEATIQLALPTTLGQITAAAPQRITQRHALEWEGSRSQFRVLQHDMIGEIIVNSRQGNKPSQQALVTAFLAWVRQKGLEVLPWDQAAEQLRERLLCAQEWLSETPWPAMEESALLDKLEQWLSPTLLQLPTLGNFSKINLSDALYSLLTWEQRRYLDTELPKYFTVPTGSRLALRYRQGQFPLLAVRVQEMYGQESTPMVAQGRIPLVIELLSPAQRPIQITQDLAGFWRGSWRDVQKEMKGRYPKHLWPDDPANTPPTTRTRKHSR